MHGAGCVRRGGKPCECRGSRGLGEGLARVRQARLALVDGVRREWGSVSVRVLRRWWERARGLLGTWRHGAGAVPVLLLGCSSVHTFGMRYAIDVSMADEAGRVLASWRALPPGRVVWARGARHVLERPSSAGPWPGPGDQIVLRDVAASPDM